MTSDTLHLLLFYAFTDLIACLTPGPAVLAVTSHALAGSRRGGRDRGDQHRQSRLVHAGGRRSVGGRHRPAPSLRGAALGRHRLSLWIGIQAWRQPDETLALRAATDKAGFGRGLLSAAAVQLSNPKALLFFTVILPPFINPSAPIGPQIAALAVIGVMIEASVLALYALLAWRLGRYAASRTTNRIINRTSGGLLIMAALGIAATGKLKS
ncbi:MAG: LysE family translocator [Sphingobium sp.]